MKRAILFIVLVTFTCLACTSTEQRVLNCDELLDVRLHQVIFQNTERDALLENIAYFQGISEEDLSVEYLESDVFVVSWQFGNRSYILDIQKSVPVSLTVFNNANQTIEQAIICLGTPDGYLGTVSDIEGTTIVEISLFYPTIGFEIRGNYQKRGNIDPLTLVNKDMPIKLLVFAQPGTMEYFVNEVYNGTSSELRDALFEHIREWPNDWSSILIEQWSEIISSPISQ